MTVYRVPCNLYFLHWCYICIFCFFVTLINILSHLLCNIKYDSNSWHLWIDLHANTLHLSNIAKKYQREKGNYPESIFWVVLCRVPYLMLPSVVKLHSLPFSADSMLPGQGVEACLFHRIDVIWDIISLVDLWPSHSPVAVCGRELFIALVN